MAEGRADRTSPYRQVQFALDDELVDIAPGDRAITKGTATADLEAAIAEARKGSPYVVTREMFAGAVTDPESEAASAVVAALSRIQVVPTPPPEELVEEPEAPVQTDRVGVVFVHGVGSQPESETVREFGEPLIEWVEQWHKSRDIEGFEVLWSRLSYGSSRQGPAAYAIRIPEHRSHQAQTWFLAEAWWASRLAAPSVGAVLGWALGSYPGLIRALWKNAWRVLRGKHYDGGPRMSQLGRAIASVNAVLILLAYTIAFIPGQLLIVLLILAASVPIPGFQQFVLLRVLQPLLVNNLGDFVVYMTDDVQAVHIRQSVYDAVSWLVREKRCARVLVVAHSQGTVVTFDALSTKTPGGDQSQGPSLEKDLQKVTKVITFGAAINRMWEERDRAEKDGRVLRQFENDLRRGEQWRDLYSEFDWAPVGPLKYGRSAHREPVTNNLSALSDHGEYFRNHEQWTSLLAQEIDSEGDRRASRFWPEATEKLTSQQRVDANRLHRERRVTTWTLWRSAAWAAVFLAYVFRYGGVERGIAADAVAILKTATDLPVIGSIPSVLTLIGNGAAAAAGIAPWLATVAEWIRLAFAPVVLTAGAVGALIIVVYLVMSAVLFKPWHRGASLSTASTTPEEWSWWTAAWRTGAYTLVIAGAAYAIVWLPPLGEVGTTLTGR